MSDERLRPTGDLEQGAFRWAWAMLPHRLRNSVRVSLVLGVIGAIAAAIVLPPESVAVSGKLVVSSQPLSEVILHAVVGFGVGFVGAVLVIFVASVLHAPVEQRNALRSDLKKSRAEHTAYVAQGEQERARRPLDPAHEGELRRVLAKLDEPVAAVALKDLFLFADFEQHVPNDEVWDYRRKHLDLMAQQEEATRAFKANIEEATAGAGFTDFSYHVDRMADQRLKELLAGEDRQEPREAWLWNETTPGVGNASLGSWIFGQDVDAQDYGIIQANIRSIWLRIPTWAAVKDLLRIESEIRGLRLAMHAHRADLELVTLNGTRCDHCDPPATKP